MEIKKNTDGKKSLLIDENVHMKLKTHCKFYQKNMKDVVEMLIEAHTDKYNPRNNGIRTRY